MSKSALTTTAASWHCAIVSSSIAARGIPSVPAWFTTPRSICSAPTRSTPSRSMPGSPQPTRFRTRLIGEQAVQKPPLPWSASSISLPASAASNPPTCACATWSAPTKCPITSAFPIATASRSSTTAAIIRGRCGRRSTRSAASRRFASATVRIDPSGKIFVSSGACPQGQGMETIFAQVVADAWCVDPADVVMSLADTAAIAIGFGTIASRSTVTLSAAIHGASERLRAKVFAIAANLLECAAGDLELRKDGVGIVGVPGADVSLATVARAARPGWDHGRPPGVDAGLEETYYYEPPTVTWSYAVHVAAVDVDIELGRVKIEKYVIAHDCGVVVNPMLVEGQIVGGAAQGLGGALLEEFNYDSEGQLLAGSLMDYMVPTACEIPDMHLIHQHSPSPLNPLGVKGVGEGGPIAPPAVIANAVSDALRPFAVEFNRTPIKPQVVQQAVRSASQPR